MCDANKTKLYGIFTSLVKLHKEEHNCSATAVADVIAMLGIDPVDLLVALPRSISTKTSLKHTNTTTNYEHSLSDFVK